jgi:DNA-binding NarL/FixJ family response regulator
MTLRVLIADDHPPTRAGVRGALERDDEFEVCAEAANAADAVAAARAFAPDVALLDIHMPGDGLDAARGIVSGSPSTAVVMLTVSRDDNDLFDALSAGARGYLLKDIDPDRLPLALRGVLAGEAALPRGLVARVIEEFRSRERRSARRSGPLARLTEREAEILERLGDGRTTNEIAAEMFVSAVTVRTHVSAILRKLRVPDRAAAVRLARDS